MKTVSKIIIYPIKSLNGVSLPIAKVTSTGFKNDRKFMLMSYAEKKMITLREFPSLYSIKVSMSAMGCKQKRGGGGINTLLCLINGNIFLSISLVPCFWVSLHGKCKKRWDCGL